MDRVAQMVSDAISQVGVWVWPSRWHVVKQKPCLINALRYHTLADVPENART